MSNIRLKLQPARARINNVLFENMSGKGKKKKKRICLGLFQQTKSCPGEVNGSNNPRDPFQFLTAAVCPEERRPPHIQGSPVNVKRSTWKTNVFHCNFEGRSSRKPHYLRQLDAEMHAFTLNINLSINFIP